MSGNRNGLLFENKIEQQIKKTGIEENKNIYSIKDDTHTFYKKQVKYKRIFGNIGRLDFVLYICGQYINIEAKYQKSRGSVYEKFPCIYHEVKQSDVKNWIIIAKGEGDGIKDISKGVDFLRKKTLKYPNVIIITNENQLEIILTYIRICIKNGIKDWGTRFDF